MAQYKQKLNPLTSQFNLVPSAIITFKASVANEASLPSSGNEIGDARITEDTDHWYSWDGSAWNDQGIFVANNWENINGRPSSSVADIDDAVSKKHTQGTDQGLDTGGANEVTAAQAKAGYTHSGVITGNPHQVNKTDVGLGNVDNKSEATIITDVKADVDIADAITKKHAASGQFNQATAAEISALTDKATPVDADVILGEDSAHATPFSKIKITWANIKATLKSYFDTLYELAGAVSSHASLTTGVHGVGAGTIAKVSDITASQVGLGNCDNTSDANKPVSTAQDTAIKETKHIEFLIDGNGFVITDGIKTPYKFVPFACTITGWDILASNSDSFTVDILYNATFSAAPASITGVGTKPNVSASASGSGTDLTNWTATTLAKGGILAFQVAGTPAAATWAVLRIRVS